jgi:hypothetical protein
LDALNPKAGWNKIVIEEYNDVIFSTNEGQSSISLRG